MRWRRPMNQERFTRNQSRREMLRTFGLGSAGLLFGLSPFLNRAPDLESGALAADSPACVVRPQQTEGPYFIDEKLNRADIRAEPSDGYMRPVAPLRLAFHVSRIDSSTCISLSGAIVDIWHCDAGGAYSDVHDQNAGFDTRGKKFLRGYQTTNAGGITEFLTIYPGWYAGRAVHIHFKIRTGGTSRGGSEFTSQLYFDESVTDQVHKTAPYNSKSRRRTLNENDFAFRQGGKELLLVPSKSSQGYLAKFDIGLKLS